MRNLSIGLGAAAAMTASAAWGGAAASPAGPADSAGAVAHFAWFGYEGTEPGPIARGHYRNPILAGFYPDPSVVRVGRDFYMVNSTFQWFPGLPIWHSRDLVHWEQIGNAIDRPGMIDYPASDMSRGLFAATIRYHSGRFYIVNTCIECGGNFVITATDPRGPWSAPVWLPGAGGIDPSLFFDEDGSAWMVWTEQSPHSRYTGHCALWLSRFDPERLALVGERTLLVDGGVDPASNPVWLEGPHIFRHKGHYYLMAAEGGTGLDHAEVIFRADQITGPYRPAPAGANPILTQRDLPPGRTNPITATGHADLVELADGRWAAVFLGTRPYAEDMYNTGRETFLLPVDWSGDWPRILGQGRAVPRSMPPLLPPVPLGAPQSGSFARIDRFAATRLGPAWMTMRGAQIAPRGGALSLAAQGSIGALGRPQFVALRQQHARARFTTAMRFAPAEGDAAGIAAVQNQDYFITLALERRQGRLVMRAARRAGASEPAGGVTVAQKLVPAARRIRLQMSANGAHYTLSYALDGGAWRVLARDVDGTNLSTQKALGFVGAMVGPFAQHVLEGAGHASAGRGE